MEKLTRLEGLRAEALGKFGGFSHRFIASIVFGKSMDAVTDVDRYRISHHLRMVKIRVTDWRNGRTPEARDYAGTATKQAKRKAG